MGTAEIEQAAKMLHTYGPWGIVVILLVAILFLYENMSKKIDDLNDHYGKLLEKRHDQFIGVLEDSAATLKQATTEISSNKKLNQDVIRLVTKVDTRLDSQN